MPRGKKRIVSDPAPIPAFTPDEQRLVEKYPGHRFKPGSLAASGATPGYGTKRTVTILCTECDAERLVATSDLFVVRKCRDCVKRGRQDARRARKVAAKEAKK